jgi:acyl-CoA reductase-like NAD-dependent aldehyde dehydrogenase/nicotinamidase-related amidase
MKPLLLFVDLQNDFLASPSLEPAAGEVVEGAGRLLAAGRSRGLPVAHALTSIDRESDRRMPHWKANGRWACVVGTPGHEPPPPVRPLPNEPVVAKTDFSAFSTGELDGILAAAGADALVLAGVHLHGCVRATALDAYARRLSVVVAEDAVGSDDPLHAAVTRRYLEKRAVRFETAETILARWAAPSSVGAAPRLPAAVIAGREIRPGGLGEVRHVSPRDRGDPLFAVPLAGPSEAAAAAASVAQARGPWASRSPAERAAVLSAFGERLEAEVEELARQMAREVGKPVALGRAEVRRAAELLRAAGPADEDPAPAGAASRARRRPLGVVALVTPWNNPVAIPAGKIGAALAWGNGAVWKPAPAATRVALRMLELLREAGAPEELVALVAGDREAAIAVMEAGEVAGVSLSGSSRAGWAAQEVCARRRIPLQAELGGNNAAIVWTGADPGQAADRIARGAFAFSGQRCTANRRAVVDARLYDRFLEEAVAAAGRIACGDPLDPATEAGPLISDEAVRRIEAFLARARSDGASVVAPCAESPAFARLRAAGPYVSPVIVHGAPPGSEIVSEETFGPVLVLQRARDFDEALSLADGVRQGLVGALIGGSPGERDRFLGECRVGILKLDASTADADARAPFGGWKSSGLGPPEHGPGNREFYTRTQAVYDGGPS